MTVCRLQEQLKSGIYLSEKQWRKFGTRFDILRFTDNGLFTDNCWCGCNGSFTYKFTIETLNYEIYITKKDKSQNNN